LTGEKELAKRIAKLFDQRNDFIHGLIKEDAQSKLVLHNRMKSRGLPIPTPLEINGLVTEFEHALDAVRDVDMLIFERIDSWERTHGLEIEDLELPSRAQIEAELAALESEFSTPKTGE
jgi:hypothetical protein